MTERDFFFCYNLRLSAFLRYKGINYITKAVNPKNQLMFSLYVKNDDLQKALDEYKSQKQEG